MADIIKHLNELKLNLEGKNKVIITIYYNVKAFQAKRWLRKCQFKIGNLVHFETCESMFVQSESQLSI
jgi:hypothetical protein